MKTVCFNLKPETDLDIAWQFLQSAGVHLLYSEEETDAAKRIYGILPPGLNPEILLEKMPDIISIVESTFPDIDWQAQWQDHGRQFSDGFVHLGVQDFGFVGKVDPHWAKIRLEPGPGFGDLSHPTTCLVLELMAKHVEGKQIIDIGCGSGVLALAAIAMGAKKAIGVDIDPQALEHAYKNAALNGMEKFVEFCLSDHLTKVNFPVIVAMNMISSEQKTAMHALKDFFPHISMALTSGIRIEERQSYLELVKEWGWKPAQEIEKDGWLGFNFSIF